ncbi:MAG: carboxypeptidase regulatory-like domain-containing protein, partial [Bryobacteraceae bacterium]|nr:carboxypeptidase regulatory-like domain-containing protein [Bryobacteraceae bacterium]
MNRRRAPAILIAACLFTSASLDAQTTTGTLLGTVRDASGAVVPDAIIVVTSEKTGLSAKSLSDQVGNYLSPNLPPDSYRLSVEKGGFRRIAVEGLLLSIGATVRRDVTLETGSVEQTINVTASAPVISTDTSGVASLIDSQQILSFPLNGRTLDRLIQFTAGNVGTNSGQPQIGGTPRIGGTFWSVDGIPYQDVALGRAVPTAAFGLGQFPSIDTIQEIKIETTLAKAEYDGPVPISILTRSGTNEFHGTLFWFNRNREFAARPFFLSPSQPKPVFNRNEFGGVIGGPVWKNKMFFQFSYEGMRRRTARTVALSVATPSIRSGDFAGLAPIRDPVSNAQFPGNRIPASRIDPRANRLQEFLPLANGNGTGAAGTGINFFDVVGEQLDHDRPSLRVDHFLSERHRLTLNLNYADSSPTFLATGTPPNYGNLADNGRRTKTGSLGINSVLTPTVVNEFRYSYFMNMEFFQGQNKDFDPSSIIPGLYQPLSIGGLPTVAIAGFQGISDFGGAAGLAPQITNQFSDNVTKVLSSHALKAGFELASVRQSRPPNTEAPSFGQFTFNGRYTGNAYADFLLGAPVESARARPSLVSLLHYVRYSAFFQDDWKLNSRVTLNLGLRYFGQTGPQERDGSMSNFDPVTGRFVVRSVGGRTPEQSIPRLLESYPIGKSEDIGWGSTLITGDSNNFGPRLGFAWRPLSNNRTVVRAGYGLYYIPAYHGYGLFGTFFANPPFFLSETFEATAGNTPSLSLANAFPGTGAIPANPRVLAVQRDLQLGYTQQWNLTLEREMFAGAGLRLSYIGNKGNNLHRSQTNWNLPRVQAPGTIQSQRPFQPWSNIPALVFDG